MLWVNEYSKCFEEEEKDMKKFRVEINNSALALKDGTVNPNVV